MGYAQATMTGHPSEPETFEFSQVSYRGDRVRRRIKAFVTYDDRWSPWRRAVVRLLASTLSRLALQGAQDDQ